jgi:hypothetical protein
MEGQKNRYHFVAVNAEGRKFSGTIWAESESAAREKISERGLALFSIEEFSASSVAITEGFKQFEFEGKGKDHKPVRGTIESVSGYEAYRKLREEYDFDITNVISLSATPEERQFYQQKGIPPEWIVQYNIEVRKNKGGEKKEIKKKKETEGDEEPLLSEQDRAELKFYQEEIGNLTSEVLKLLQENEDFLNAAARREILDRIGLLSRLRRSNAIDHLRELTKKLLKQLSEDKLFIETEKLSQEQQLEMIVRKSQFSEFSKTLEKKVTSGIAAVSIGLASIDTEKVKTQIREADIFRQIVQLFYIAIISLLGLMILFWGVNAVRLLANFSQSSILFSFASPLLWMLTGISLILTFTLFPLVYSWERLVWKQKLFFLGISVLGIAIFLWFFPILFWWTR